MLLFTSGGIPDSDRAIRIATTRCQKFAIGGKGRTHNAHTLTVKLPPLFRRLNAPNRNCLVCPYCQCSSSTGRQTEPFRWSVEHTQLLPRLKLPNGDIHSLSVNGCQMLAVWRKLNNLVRLCFCHRRQQFPKRLACCNI